MTNTDGKIRRYECPEGAKVSQAIEEDGSGLLTVAAGRSYDTPSRLIQINQGARVRRSFSQDALNRVAQKSSSASTPAAYCTYDSRPMGSPIAISNPVGRLTKAATTGGATRNRVTGRKPVRGVDSHPLRQSCRRPSGPRSSGSLP